MPLLAMLGRLGLVAGWPVLAFGPWRSGLLGTWRALDLAAPALPPIAVVAAGQPGFAAVPLAGMAFALARLGVALP
jgi:hypothetical protein